MPHTDVFERARSAGRRGLLGAPRAHTTRWASASGRWIAALLLALAATASLEHVSSAQAGTFVAYLCQSPSDALVGSSGLHEQLLQEAWFVTGESRCADPGQQVTMQLGPNAIGYSNLQGGEYVYSTPAGVTISAFSMTLSAYAAPCALASGACPGGVGQVFVNHTGELDPYYDFRDLGAGAEGPTTIDVGELQGVNDVTIGATCDAGCPSAQEIASFQIPRAQFTLFDSTVPKIVEKSGPSESAAPLSGRVEWRFTASDSGPGVYSVADAVDGKPPEQRVLDEDGGLCRNLSQSGARAFASPQPCPSEASGSVSLNTNDLPDGEHTVHVYVEDASGDAADLFDGKLITDNGPIVREAPSITGAPEIGSSLKATTGSFSPRPEQGPVDSLAGQWARCVSASSCEPIPGATGTSYVPTAADLGYELVYESTATTKVTDALANGLTHTTRTDSAPTPEVSPAGGFGALGSTSPWRVSLHVSPRRVHQGTRIKLSGKVNTVPLPAAGKLVYLQARELSTAIQHVRGRQRKVTIYGGWITFMALRANAKGSFAAAYRFRLGGRHTYQFRAVAPAEGQFRNATGSSPAVTVQER
jgi:hypothetical protein